MALVNKQLMKLTFTFKTVHQDNHTHYAHFTHYENENGTHASFSAGLSNAFSLVQAEIMFHEHFQKTI